MTSPTSPVGLNRFASLGLHRLSYEFIPAVPPSRRPAVPIVLLHALLVGRPEFAGLRQELRGDYPLILPDARGHGASAGLADQRYSTSEIAAELAAVLDAAETDTAHLIGHELGALAAIAYAVRSPDRVRSLTLIEPELLSLLDLNALDAGDAGAIQESRTGDETAADTAYKGLGDRAVDQYLQPRWGSGWRDRIPKPRLATIRRNSGSLAGLLAALNSAALNPEAIAGIAAPTLIIRGTAARLTIRLTADRLVALLPAASLSAVPSPESGVDLFDPDTSAAVLNLVRNFLTGVPT